MKISNLIIHILAIVFIFPQQGMTQGAMPFTLIEPSPLLNGMGRVGTALPNNESFGFFYNPAQLGYTSKDVNFSFEYYPQKVNWLPGFHFSDLNFNSLAANLGYNLQEKFELPFSVGLGYLYTKLNLGENHATDENGNDLGTFQSYEYSHALGLGIGFDYYIHFSVGLTYKLLTSNLVPIRNFDGSELRENIVEASAIDFGFLLKIPLAKYFVEKYLIKSNKSINVSPVLDLSLGYAKVNIGDKVAYIDPNQLDPLSRQARLGYALSGGIDVLKHQMSLNMFMVDWSVDAHDLLLSYDDGSLDYQSGCLGDIHIGNNLLKGNSDDKVDVYQGLRFSFLEVVQITSGKWEGLGWGEHKTSGFAIGLKGVFKLLYLFSDNEDYFSISNHFNFKYAYSIIDAGGGHPLDGIEYSSLQLVITSIL